MYFPLISSPKKKLYRRKGGGGGGKGGSSSGGSKGGTSGSSGSSSSAGTGSTISSAGTSRSASSTSSGGGKAVAIPAGQPFAGRQSGGGTRNEVYGTQVYGSGYPGIASRGVSGLGFPFVFWPLAWGGIAGAGGAAYLHSTEYGKPDNTTRPGGPLFTATFPSSSNNGNSTFRLLSDNTTVTTLISTVQSNCTSFLLNSSSIVPQAYTDNSSLPQPEQTVQYYRASSVALTLDGYNDTAALSSGGGSDTPLPSWVDRNMLECLNDTIGTSVPLVDGAIGSMQASMGGIVGLVWIMWMVLGVL